MAPGERRLLELETQATGTTDAALLNELAATYLAQPRWPSRPTSLILAAGAADRALEAEPSNLAARFNKALALTRLPLPDAARRAWWAYLAADGESPWAVEARRNLEELKRYSAETTWKLARATIFEALRGDRPAIAEPWVRRFHGACRDMLFEQVLGDWAAASLSGNPDAAVDHLKLAQGLATLLAQVFPEDELPRDTVDRVVEASARPDFRLISLATGHLGYARFRRDAGGDAELAAAIEALEAAGSPLALLAAYRWAVSSRGDDYAAADETFRHLRQRVDSERYPVLAGYLEWLLGLGRFGGGDYGAALRHYRAAAALLRSAGHPKALDTDVLVAETMADLGLSRETWSLRLGGLEETFRRGEKRSIHRRLTEVVFALVAEGRPDLAEPFLDQLMLNARRSGDDSFQAEALIQSVRVAARTGRDFRPHLAAARRLLAGLEASPLHPRLAAELDVEAASLMLARDPASALALLDAAAKVFTRIRHEEILPRLLLFRARAHRALGSTGRAAEDLRRGIELVEERRGEPEDSRARIAYFENAQTLFDELISLLLDELADPLAAFEIAERARCRDLREDLGEPASSPRNLAAVLEAMPEDLALVQYAVLPDRLVAWRLRRGELETLIEPVDRDAIRRHLSVLTRSPPSRAGDEGLKQTFGLFFELFARRPLAGIEPGTRLVFVPDRDLHGLPFAALFDERRDRYLVQDHAVAAAPSSSMVLHWLEHDGVPRGEQTVLAVGDPAFDEVLFDRLQRLASAEEEAEHVAALDGPGSTLLVAGEATLAEGRTRFGYVPRGRRVGVLDLTGLDVEVQVEHARRRRSSGGGCSYENGVGTGQREPNFFGFDEDAFEWLATVRDVDKRAGRLKNAVNDPLHSNDLVVSRIFFDRGDFETHVVARHRKGLLKGKVIRWHVSEENSQPDEFPRALAEETRFRLRRLLEVRLVDSEDRLIASFYRRRGRVRWAISNVPPTEIQEAQSRQLHHFRHYYRLYETDGITGTEPCNVPSLDPRFDLGTVLGKTTSCPPSQD